MYTVIKVTDGITNQIVSDWYRICIQFGHVLTCFVSKTMYTYQVLVALLLLRSPGLVERTTPLQRTERLSIMFVSDLCCAV